MLLKRFVDANGWLHASKDQGDVFRCRPENLFLQRELYTTQDADGRLQRQMETKLGALESKAEPILARMVEAARAGKTPGLTPSETSTWLLFLFLQWKRVPDLHLTVNTDDEARQMLDAILEDVKREHPDKLEALELLSHPDNKARTLRNARVDTLGSASPMVLQALLSRGLALVRIMRPDKRFVIASRPVVKLTSPGKTDLRHPECELWLPIASDIMVGLGRGFGTETLIDISSEHIRRINIAAISQSTTFASGSPTLTRSLASAR